MERIQILKHLERHSNITLCFNVNKISKAYERFKAYIEQHGYTITTIQYVKAEIRYAYRDILSNSGKLYESIELDLHHYETWQRAYHDYTAKLPKNIYLWHSNNNPLLGAPEVESIHIYFEVEKNNRAE